MTHLRLIKSHVMAQDVELHGSGASVTFDPMSIERQWVSKLVSHWEGEAEVALVPEAVQHVEHRAAGRLVGLQEHDVGVGLTEAQRGALSIRGQEDGVASWMHTAGGGRRNVTLD